MTQPTLQKKLLAILLRVLFSVTLTLGIFEAALQGVARLGPWLSGEILESSLPDELKAGLNSSLFSLYQYTQGSFSWEQYFVANYERGTLVYQGLHRPHPSRGWSLKPNLSEQREQVHYSTNADGFRSLYEFEVDRDRYGVLVVGDSFSFGDGVDDADTWPSQLQGRDARLNVFNLAGTGYGIDQMYITLREEIARYKPQLVVAAFIDEDLHRSLLPFRDFKKPRFLLENDELVLSNVPIGEMEEVYREANVKLQESAGVFQLPVLYRVLRGRTQNFQVLLRSEKSCDRDCQALNQRLFEEMSETAHEHGAEFMMVYLPWGRSIKENIPSAPTEVFFRKYRSTHENSFINSRRFFLRAKFEKAVGHYTGRENKLVSTLVRRKIMSLDSWRDFVGDDDKPEAAGP